MTRRAAMQIAAAPVLPDISAVVKRAREPFAGLQVGLASYSTRKLSLEETLALCRRVGIRHLTLKSGHLALTSTGEERRAVREKVAEAGLVLGGCGVIYLHNEAEARRAFEYARELGAQTVVIGINEAMVPVVDKVLGDFELRAAIHNHGPQDKQGAFSPLTVMGWVKGTGTKLGVCMDVGHTWRCGLEPTAVARKCFARLFDIHVKDLNRERRVVPVGQGAIEVAGLLKTLVKLGYRHQVALEYEADAARPEAGIAESIGYQRGVLAAI
jgi:sugar phosphate isomerase/epimerase